MIDMKKDSEGDENHEVLGQTFRNNALDIKGRFMTMQQISRAYAQVSLEYIMPGFEIVGRMALSEFKQSSGQVSAKSSELSEYSTSATVNIRSVVIKVSHIPKSDS